MRVIGDVTTLTGESLWTLEGLVHPSYLSTQSRFVDRDMMMRYHWGLGIGHTYSHSTSPIRSNPDSEHRNFIRHSPQQFSGNETTNYANDAEYKFDDLEHLIDPESELEFEHLSSVGSDLESDSESESVWEDYADLDGWGDLDNADAVNGYEF